MGMDVVAIIEWDSDIYSLSHVQELVNSASSFFGENFKEGWEYDLPIQSAPNEHLLYLDNDQVLVNFSVSCNLLTINYPLRWARFCQNIDNTFDTYYEYYLSIAKIFSAKEILFVPDSSALESKVLDILETKSKLDDIKNSLIELGSSHKTREKIIYIENGLLNSNGYFCEKIT